MQNISELMVQMKNVFKKKPKRAVRKRKEANSSLSRLKEMHLLHFFFCNHPVRLCQHIFHIFLSFSLSCSMLSHPSLSHPKQTAKSTLSPSSAAALFLSCFLLIKLRVPSSPVFSLGFMSLFLRNLGFLLLLFFPGLLFLLVLNFCKQCILHY